MGSKQAIELEKWEIKGFTAEKAINLLTRTSFISGPNIMFAIAYLIQKQERMIDKACEKLGSGDCLFEGEPCPENYIDVGCKGCVRRWLEQEAQHG